MEQQDTLSVHEWSALLSFLELLRQNSSKTELELNKLNLFEQNYVFNSLAFLKSVAHKIHKCKIILQNKSDHYVCLFVDLQNSPLSSETLDFLYTQAQQNVSKKAMFRYVELVTKLLNGVRGLIESLIPQHKSQLQKIEWNPNFISGESSLAKLETSFGTGFMEINFPDANLFNDQHVEFCKATPSNGKLLYRDFYAQCINWMPHEFVHCLDTITGPGRNVATDSPEMNWQAEHIASSAQMLLLCAVSNINPDLLKIGYEGFASEVMLWFYDYVCYLHRQEVSVEDKKEYEHWRQHSRSVIGKKQPYELYEETTPRYHYPLARLAIETFATHWYRYNNNQEKNSPSNPNEFALESVKRFVSDLVSDPTRKNWPTSPFVVDPNTSDLELLMQPPNKSLFPWNNLITQEKW